jgi:hypothetical protein
MKAYRGFAIFSADKYRPIKSANTSLRQGDCELHQFQKRKSYARHPEQIDRYCANYSCGWQDAQREHSVSVASIRFPNLGLGKFGPAEAVTDAR